MFMLATSGLRASELCSLRWQDLDHVDGTWTARFIGKGGLSAEQEASIRSPWRPAGSTSAPPSRGIPGQRTRSSGRCLHSLVLRRRRCCTTCSGTVSARSETRARAAGILKRELQFSPHLFRRSYATALYKSGMGLKAIQEKTRHANIEVLTRHYISDERRRVRTSTRYFRGRQYEQLHQVLVLCGLPQERSVR